MRIRAVFFDDSSIVLNLGGEDDESTTSVDSSEGDAGSSSAVGSDSGDSDSSLVDDSLSLSVSDASIVDTEQRPLLSTPLDDYTVTEGLLLLAVIFMALFGVVAFIRGR